MDNRLFFPATERNRDPILSVLKSILPSEGNFLEIASGSGEHLVHFAPHFPKVTWQPSDLDPQNIESVKAWVDHKKLANVKAPISLDTTAETDNQENTDAILCINMIHISPWEATLGLMAKAGKWLNDNGILFLYGPYRRNGAHTAPSNAEFESWLQEKDPRFGVRDLEEVEAEAHKNGLDLTHVIDMPANNFSVVFQKR